MKMLFSPRDRSDSLSIKRRALRSLFMIGSLFLAAASLVAAEQDAAIDDFFRTFSEAWGRRDPESATRMKLFGPEEQARLDGLLTDVSAAHARIQLQMMRDALTALGKFDRTKLSSSRRVSADVLEWLCRESLRTEPFLDHRFVFNFDRSDQNRLISFLTQQHPIRTRRDAQNYVARLGLVGNKVDQWIERAKTAGLKGIIPPRIILDASILQLRRFIEGPGDQNVLVKSFADKMEQTTDIASAERAQLIKAAQKQLVETVYPAWHRTITLLESQRTIALEEGGLWRLANGAAAYQSALRWNTTTNLSAAQIHQIGLRETGRIEKELDSVLRRLGLVGGSVVDRYAKLEATASLRYADVPAVRDLILEDYGALIRSAELKVGSMFRLPASRPVVVRRMPTFRESSGLAEYQAPPTGGNEPGIFYVPLVGPSFTKLGMARRAFHEVVPGHHFQALFLLQLRDTASFQKTSPWGNVAGRALGQFPAFAEGWATYAEKLADELGLYGDDNERAAFLRTELSNGVRLVAETGLHAKRWTNQQTIDYLKERGVPPRIETFITDPGQQCAYEIGGMRILQMRERARKILGPKFDLRDFHSVILGSGNMPLEVLDRLVGDYIASISSAKTKGK